MDEKIQGESVSPIESISEVTTYVRSKGGSAGIGCVKHSSGISFQKKIKFLLEQNHILKIRARTWKRCDVGS